ncbi:MAG: hypothetical protein GX860_00770 [Alcaligenaceae bacterium]|nr:hypothetical protein [Alcaligenaceae bacterium]
MRITSLSKKIIVVIIAVTFALVALVGLLPQDAKSPEIVPDAPAELMDTEALNKKKQEEALIRSLTNFSHDIDSYLLSEGEVLYTGYIKGAGNAIFHFNAQEGQQLVVELAEQESQLFEMLLFNNFNSSVFTLISGEPFMIPSNGLYELRVVYRSHIEVTQAVEDEKHQAVPQAFNLTLKLQ